MIKIIQPYFGEEEKQAVIEIMESQQITRGKWTQTFQSEFARYVGTNHCLSLIHI